MTSNSHMPYLMARQRKLWIKWQLVGNPDLGFIDHDYRL